MRFNHLAAVVEINFVSVVSGRVVAGREVDPGRGIGLAHGEAQLGRRARFGKNQRIAAEFGDDFGRQVGEFPGKVARVVADADPRPGRQLFTPGPLLDVGHQPLRGPAHIAIIHRVGPRAGKLRPVHGLRRAALGGRHDRADRLAPQPAGPERQGAEEPVVQLLPVSRGSQFGDTRPLVAFRVRGEQRFDVFQRGPEQPVPQPLLQQSRKIFHRPANIRDTPHHWKVPPLRPDRRPPKVPPWIWPHGV